MEFRRDERAQSVVIGSLLVFTILVLSFSGYQAFVVPNQNAQVEIDHSQTIRDQFAELHTNAVNAVGSDTTRSTNIDLGPTYPTRAVALNPPPAAGKLQTRAEGDVSIEEGGTTRNVCSDGETTPTTRSLVYTPSYNEFRQPESVGYESRVVSRQFRSSSLFDQRLVQSGSSEISLYLLTGSVDENGVDTYSLELNASDEYTTTLTDPTITVPSRFDAGTWEDEILADRSDVTATDVGDRVELDFNGGDYRVSCAVVGLDDDPAFTPPDGGTGTGGADGAYSTEWRDPSGELGTTSCSDTECTLDASASETLDLTAETIPKAEDATVSFSVSNSTIGTVTPTTKETDSEGNASTRMRVQANGIVRVYASSGGSGDVINVTVENFVPLSATAVFTDDSKSIRTAENSTGTTKLVANAEVLGPLVSNIDGNGSEDIPYVPAGGTTVHIVNPDGSNATELSSNNAKSSKSLLGVGRWDGARTSVYFADDNGATIYRTNPSEGDVEVVKPENGVSAVAGPADIDGDDTNELVYADDSQVLRYFEPGAGPGKAKGTKIYDIGSNDGIGLGRPADFDGDGTARIPVVDGSGRLVLVDSTGSGTELVGSSFDVAKSPVAAVDWDEDGKLEVMYLTTSGGLKYVDDITGSPTVKDTGISEPRGQTGVT